MSAGSYYVPEQSSWPFISAIALLILFVGLANWIHGHDYGFYMVSFGLIATLAIAFGWFRDVIHESLGGKYDMQMDRSFRWSMGWFIFSEVMFFAAFFGALFYIRVFALPWLGGEGDKASTHLLWEGFKNTWPLLVNPDTSITGPKDVIPVFWNHGVIGIPLLNTILLISSGVTLTIAHHALKAQHHGKLIFWLGCTIVLGVTFLGFQVYEYIHAHHDYDLTFHSGIYGSTFYMLTGFHGAHVTLGAIMLTVMFFRATRRHFTPEKHFAFESVAWYWHFVDVVWILLFIFVYWI